MGNETLPDYSTYSLFELQDAYRHVDKARYPDRAQLLKEEIEKRRQDAPVEKTAGGPTYEWRKHYKKALRAGLDSKLLLVALLWLAF